MADEDILDRLFRAWRNDIDSEPFPVIIGVVLPRQTRRHPPRDDARAANDNGEPGRPTRE